MARNGQKRATKGMTRVGYLSTRSGNHFHKLSTKSYIRPRVNPDVFKLTLDGKTGDNAYSAGNAVSV